MDKFLLTGDVTVKPVEKDGCCVYRFRNETGEGTITIYEVFPGVILSYNDFHIRYYDSEFKPDRNLFCIDHCWEGRLEYPAADDAYSYVEAGDLKLDRRLTHTGHFEMPLSHYHGAMVFFDMDKAAGSLPEEINVNEIDSNKEIGYNINQNLGAVHRISEWRGAGYGKLYQERQLSGAVDQPEGKRTY